MREAAAVAAAKAPSPADTVANLRAFAKLYGYVRFFHPSDEASSIDWERFAVLGAGHVLDCSDAESLRSTLVGLFSPFAPTVQVYGAGTQPTDVDLPGSSRTCLPVCWQHRGPGLPEADRMMKETYGQRSTYTSLRTNRPMQDERTGLPEFGACPVPGDYVDKSLDRGFSCRVPLCLWSENGQTLPCADSVALDRLRADLDAVEPDTPDLPPPAARLGAVVIAWTVAQHFYPYFEVVPTDWDVVLTETLSKALADASRLYFHHTLRRMAVALHDGHANASDLRSDKGMVKARLDIVEGRIIVISAREETGLHRGDVLLEINGRPASEVLGEEEGCISGSPHWRQALGLFRLLLGPKTDPLRFLVERGTGTALVSAIPCEPPSLPFSCDTGDCVRELEPGIWYVDLTRALEEINTAWDKLVRARGVVFDLRGYPNGNEGILSGLLTSRHKRGERWMFIPRIAWPDRERIAGWDGSGWDHLQPDEQHLEGKVVFLTNAWAISYAESVMGYVEGFKLADIVGGPTAGTNGNIVLLPLPGGFQFSWTGLKVTKFDGSQHHLIGIQPTVPLERTLEAVREGRDEYIEKALQLIRGSAAEVKRS